MSLITPDFGLLFWMVVIFGAVFFILAKFGFPIITKAVRERSKHIEESLKAAEDARLSLDKLAAQQQDLLEQARLEQGRILKEAAQTRDKMIAQAREDASREAAKVLEQARAEIATEKEDALREIRTQLSSLSVAVAEKVVRKELEDSAEQRALLERYASEAEPLHLN